MPDGFARGADKKVRSHRSLYTARIRSAYIALFFFQAQESRSCKEQRRAWQGRSAAADRDACYNLPLCLYINRRAGRKKQYRKKKHDCHAAGTDPAF